MDDARREKKEAYANLFKEVTSILYRHDPVFGGMEGLPEDEYDLEAGTILPRLRQATDVNHVERIVREVLDLCFGPFPQPVPPGSLLPTAEDIWTAWNRLGPI